METKKLVIHQENMHCQQCLNNIIMVLSHIKKIIFLDINMESGTIKLKYQDEVLDNNQIRYMIECAILV